MARYLHIDENILSIHTVSKWFIFIIATTTIRNTIPRAKMKIMAMRRRHAFVIGIRTFKGSQDDVVVMSLE